MDAIFPYVKSEQIFTCPSDSGSRRIYKRQVIGGPDVLELNYGSYCMNNQDYNPGTPVTPPVGISLSQFATPATTVWVTDGQGNFENSQEYSYDTTINIAANPRTLGETIERHLDTTVVLYCDDHVKSHKLSALGARTGANFLKYWSVEDD
jgi:hypothetical protein